MWQVLLAAAVAGSTGLVAKHILSSNVNPNATPATDKSIEYDEKCKDPEGPDSIVKSEVPIETKLDSPMVSDGLNVSERDDVFRFSSSGSRGATSSRNGAKNSRKKARSRWRGSVKEAGDKNVGVGDCSGAKELVMERRKSCGRFSVCLKKRKTSKNIGAAKCGSCSSKDGFLFNWGLGVGIMYMISAGKAEIYKLNTTVDETAKVVQELKSEVYKRKSSHHKQARKASADYEISGCSTIQLEHDRSSAEYRQSREMKNCTLSIFDDVECESSVLTEEPELEMHDMDPLEAELATELNKLPWCSTEESYQAGDMANIDKTKISAVESHPPEQPSSHQLHGVLPAELDQKLCHLLIEQQENQIVELESELNAAQSKLHEKESELQALKDCVRRLTEFSLSSISDDEAEAHAEKKQSNQKGCEAMRSVVGMKRPVQSESWDCYI